jgi:hypothetical protein
MQKIKDLPVRGQSEMKHMIRDPIRFDLTMGKAFFRLGYRIQKVIRVA